MLPVLLVLGSVIVAILSLVLVVQFIFNRKASDKLKTLVLPAYEKKYKEVNPAHYRGTFLRMGMIFSIGLAITAISWTTYERPIESVGEEVSIEDFEIEMPRTKPAPPPPPPEPQPEIKVVEDEKIIEDKIVLNIEIDVDDEIAPIEDVVIEDEKIEDEKDFHVIVDEMPEFPGGERALRKYLAKIPYPPIAKENGIEGKVWIRFVIDENGQPINITVKRGPEKILNEAAIRWVKQMPKWRPGSQRGKKVKVQFVLPIDFRLG